MYPFLVKKTKNWFCVIKIRNTILTITHWHTAGPVEARRKPGGSSSGLVRVSPAKAGSRAEDASTLRESGDMLPREVLKLSFSKMHILHILREN